MRAWPVVALVLASGCDWAFGLSKPPIDAPLEIDAAIDAAIDVPPPCTIPTVTLPLVEDATLIVQSPTQGHGGDPILNIGVGEVILKFDAALLPPDTKRMTLVLPYVPSANECVSGCGPCSNLDHAGQLRVAFLRSDWADASACYSYRDTSSSNPWQLLGANGASDRSPVAGMASYTSGDATIVFDAAMANTWLATGGGMKRISVVVTAFNGAVHIIRQHQQWQEILCLPEAEVPRLVADRCP